MRTPLFGAAFLSLVLCPVLRAADPPQITEAELVRRTQQMMDAVVPGDATSWKQFYADDAMYFDEKGRSLDKPGLIADLTPMPKGYSGTIKILHPKTRFAPNVAILSYDQDETEAIFGQEMHARYHSTDTWLYRNGLWQIVASQTLRYYEDPAPGTVDPARLNDYLGTYELVPGNTMTVIRTGDELFLQRNQAKPVKLLLESPDLFFRAGVEGRVLFHRDESGHVDRLIDRRNNEDIVRKRIG